MGNRTIRERLGCEAVEALAGSNNSKIPEHLSPPPSGGMHSLVLSNISRKSLETERSAVGTKGVGLGLNCLKGFGSVNKKITPGTETEGERG